MPVLNRKVSLAARLMCLLGPVLMAGPAGAMQFGVEAATTTEVFVGGRGPIVKGDVARLEQALAAVPAGRRLLALALDSPGGNVVEGEQLARLIRGRALPIVIPSNSQCVSACFLLFAASTRRFTASDALVGVHSANENGTETDLSLAVTTQMARVAAALGVPPAIIGKMVQTTPGRVEWLTPADMVLMNVTVFEGDPAGATRRTAVASGAVPAQQSATVAPLVPSPFAVPSGTQRPAPIPAPVVTDFRSSEPVEAEYQGAYFCGREAGRMTLRVFLPAGEPRHRAMIIFGPLPTSPDIPRGAFVVEGTISMSAGELKLVPVKWIAQPGGYPWFSLNGRSEDGGRTFTGRVTDNPACTQFTLRRVTGTTTAR